jgi:glycosyltransferase 2 family protein
MRKIAPRRRLTDVINWRTVGVATLGVVLLCYLLMRVGLGAVLTAAASVGWAGFGLFCLAASLVLVAVGVAWGVLLPRSSGLGSLVFVWARMVREAASDVLPFSQIGGMALGVRAAILHGVPSRLAWASMIVDVTMEMLTQIAYLALGILFIWMNTPHTALTKAVTTAFSAVLLLALSAGGAFLGVQRYGHHWVATRVLSRVFSGASVYTTAIAAALDEIYRSRARVAISLGVHFLGWLANAGCTWIAFRLVGAPVNLVLVMAVESLIYASRSAGFLIPSALGVQEAAYTVLAPMLGVGTELALAVSLLKRARDLAIGIPVLLIWHAFEGRRALVAENAGK